jgi:hypothetical protein
MAGKGITAAHGIELEERQPPSRRNPLGALRCQAIAFDSGVPHQCKKNARAPFKVCGTHGAGYRKRELEGKAQNPALARIVTGARAKPETMQQLWRDRPELRALYDAHLNDDDLFDMRPVLARAKALAAWITEHLDPTAPSGPAGTPLAFKAIQSLAYVMRVAQDLIRIERDLGPVTHAELRRLVNGIAELIRQFVPSDRQSEALAFLRDQVSRRRSDFGGES